jgi:NADH-quinone oxidoreductase subunit E
MTRCAVSPTRLLEHFCAKLHVQPGSTTLDGKITLEFAECLGACEGAPAVMINDEHRHDVTPEKADALIAELTQ